MSENAKETGNFESEFKELRKEAKVLNSDSVIYHCSPHDTQNGRASPCRQHISPHSTFNISIIDHSHSTSVIVPSHAPSPLQPRKRNRLRFRLL